MIQQDTVKLLRECDAGAQMGISAIDDVLTRVQDKGLHSKLADCKKEHQQLLGQIGQLLTRYEDDGKDPNPIARSMSWMKTNVKLGLEDSDKVIADLMTDGCNMGVKSLNRYLNQYAAADEKSKDIAKRLINLEQQLTLDIRQFL